MSCEVWKISFNPGDTFRKECRIEETATGLPVNLTGCAAELQFLVGDVPVMTFSTANDAGPDAGLGQITIASDQTGADKGKLFFYADESVANVLQAGATGLLKITWSNGDIQTMSCAEIVSCEC